MAERHQHLGSLLIFGLLLSNLVCAIGMLECEDLPIEDCAFSVASTGTRCVLEKYRGKDNFIQYECQSSIITAEKQEEWIESDECVRACGLERMTVGLSTDMLMDYHFTERFCSAECLNNCPNIIDLYVNLAAGEGMYLPHLCKTHRTRRGIADPVKKAMDAEYLRSVMAELTSVMAPDGSPIPESGLLPGGPDYRGYGGHERTSGDVSHEGAGGETIAPVSGSTDDQPAPSLQRSAPAAGAATPIPKTAAAAPAISPSSSKRPFFVFPSPTVSPIIDSSVPAPESPVSPVSSSSLPAVPATVPSSSSSAETVVNAQSFQQMNDEEYLYETYFN